MDEDKNKTGHSNHLWIRLLFLVAIVALMFVIYESGVMRFFLDKERLLAFLRSLGSLAFLGFILLQAAQVVVSPIPGDITGLIGGYMFGLFGGVLWSTIGLTIGSYVAFALARNFGRPFVERFVDKCVIDKFDYLLHSKGVFLIFLLFLIPGFPKDYLCYILGLGHLTRMEFIAISTIGRFFGTILLTLGGGFIRYHQYERFFCLLGAALIVIIFAIVYRSRVECLLKSLHIKEHERRCNSAEQKFLGQDRLR
jgi:uncharacterized membrane protein YdjX (TVP38/TMEM64 family)